MRAHSSRSRSFALLLPLAFAHGGAATPTVKAAVEREFVETEAACASEPLCTCDADDAQASGAARILALARANGVELDAAIVATLDEAGELLALLPLDRLARIDVSRERLEFVFDCGASDHVRVAIPERTVFALAEDDDGDVRPVRVTSEARTLLVHRRLRFDLGPEGIRGAVRGDIEVAAGPFHFDLALHIERHTPRAERDRFGRDVLALDAGGAPFQRDGQWVRERYDDWLVLSAMGHVIEVGLGAPVR